MTKPLAVTLAYIDAQPASAAADLSRLSPIEAGKLIDSIPIRYAVRVLGFASSWSCSRILTGRTSTKTTNVLRELPFAKAVEILRLMESETREKVLKALPRRLKRNFEISLSYPDDTVGASMTIETLAFQPEQRVQDVLAEIRSNSHVQSDLIFVVSQEYELLGIVDPLTMLRSTDHQRLEDIMRNDLQSLSARSRLASITDNSTWDKFTLLPVLSRRNHLVGALSKTVVTEKLDIGTRHEPTISPSMTAEIAGAFIHTVAELATLLADGKPSRKPKSNLKATS